VTTTPNFAHGELLTVAAYAAYVAQRLTNNDVVALLVGVVAGGCTALILHKLFVSPFVKANAKRMSIFLVTLSFAFIVQNLLLIVFSANPIVLRLPAMSVTHVGPFLWTLLDEGTMLATVAILISLHITLRYTKLGKSMRAVRDSPALAQVTGIDTPRVITITWLLDGLIAGFAGVVLAASISITPTLGFTFLPVIFAAAVVGGIGKPYGAMLGALALGVVMEVSAVYLPGEYKTTIAFGVLIVALLVRPRGLVSAELFSLNE
jgi:branched-subunit amino acid ABC-type transport system permease component